MDGGGGAILGGRLVEALVALAVIVLGALGLTVPAWLKRRARPRDCHAPRFDELERQLDEVMLELERVAALMSSETIRDTGEHDLVKLMLERLTEQSLRLERRLDDIVANQHVLADAPIPPRVAELKS